MLSLNIHLYSEFHAKKNTSDIAVIFSVKSRKTDEFADRMAGLRL